MKHSTPELKRARGPSSYAHQVIRAQHARVLTVTGRFNFPLRQCPCASPSLQRLVMLQHDTTPHRVRTRRRRRRSARYRAESLEAPHPAVILRRRDPIERNGPVGVVARLAAPLGRVEMLGARSHRPARHLPRLGGTLSALRFSRGPRVGFSGPGRGHTCDEGDRGNAGGHGSAPR